MVVFKIGNFRSVSVECSTQLLLSEHLVKSFHMHSGASLFKDLYITAAVSFLIRLEIFGHPELWINGAAYEAYAEFMIILAA